MSEHTDIILGELVHRAKKFDPLVDDALKGEQPGDV
jgi:hypothetical protein